MANNLSASFPEYWSRRMQRKYYKTKVYSQVCSYEEKNTLKKGDTVHRPYRSELVVNDLGSDGSYTRQDITDTDESMNIDQEKEATFYIREIDELQSNYKSANKYADDAGDKIGDEIDGQILGEYDNADSVVANYEVNGSGSANDGIGFTLSTSNVLKVFSIIRRKLDSLNISEDNRWGIISPEFYDVLWQFLAGKESSLGDSTGQNGHVGKYGGFNLYKSNNLAWSARLEFGTNPSDGDTVVINGVTFTFKTTLGTAAGNVHITSSAAKSLDSLVSAINTPGTSVDEATDAGYVAVSSADQKLLKNITATDGGTYMTIEALAESYVVVSETLTNASDIWTTTKQLQHNVFGQGKPVDLVLQKMPNMKIKDRSGYLGKDVVSYTVFGKKTFSEGGKKMVDVQVRSDSFA